MNEFWVWNIAELAWTGNTFRSFESAENFVIDNGGHDKYIIFERVS